MKKKSSYLPNDVVDYIALGTLSNVVIQVARWEIVRGTFFICMVVCLLEAMQMNGITKFILLLDGNPLILLLIHHKILDGMNVGIWGMLLILRAIHLQL